MVIYKQTFHKIFMYNNVLPRQLEWERFQMSWKEYHKIVHSSLYISCKCKQCLIYGNNCCYISLLQKLLEDYWKQLLQYWQSSSALHMWAFTRSIDQKMSLSSSWSATLEVYSVFTPELPRCRSMTLVYLTARCCFHFQK